MKTPILGGVTDYCSITATEYNCLSGGTSWGSTRADFEQPIPTGGTISKLKVRADSAVQGNPFRFTLVVGGVGTSLACDIAVGETTGEDSIDSISVSAGQLVCLRCSWTTAPSAAVWVEWSVIFEGTDSTESIILSNGWRSTGALYHYGLQHGGGSSADAADQFGDRSRIPTGGTLKKLYACMTVSDPDSIIFTVYKNGTITDLSASVASLVCTPDTTDTVSVSDDDYCQMQVSEGGNVGSTKMGWGLVFVPSTSGEFILLHNTVDNTIATEYNGVFTSHPGTAWSTSETTSTMLCNAFTAKKIRVCLDVAPGTGITRTFCLRKTITSDTALTVDIAGASEVNDYLVTDVSISDWDRLIIKHSVSGGTPATAQSQISIVGQIGEVVTRTSTVSMSSLLKAQNIPNTITLTSLLEKTDIKTTSLDTTIVLRSSSTINLSSLLKALDYEQVSLSALLKAFNIPFTTNLSSYIEATDYKTISFDTLVKLVAVKTFIIDVLLKGAGIQNVALDVLIKGVYSNNVSIDELLKGIGVSTVALDSLIGQPSVDILMDILLKKSDNKTVSLDALIISKPAAITQPESSVGPTTATINGKISDDGGESCEAMFRWRKVV